MDYTLILFSIHPEELPVIQAGLGDIPITYFDTNFNIELLDFYQNTYSNVTHFGILVRKIIR